jgi:hypothetical protein
MLGWYAFITSTSLVSKVSVCAKAATADNCINAVANILIDFLIVIKPLIVLS